MGGVRACSLVRSFVRAFARSCARSCPPRALRSPARASRARGRASASMFWACPCVRALVSASMFFGLSVRPIRTDVSARDVSVRVCPCVHVAVRGTVRAQTVFESLFASGRLLAGLIRSERSSHCPRLAVCAQNCSRDCPIHCSRLAACPHNGSRDRLSHCPRLAFHTCVCSLIGRGTA